MQTFFTFNKRSQDAVDLGLIAMIASDAIFPSQWFRVHSLTTKVARLYICEGRSFSGTWKHNWHVRIFFIIVSVNNCKMYGRSLVICNENSQTYMCSQFFDVKRKDFWEMFIHHNTTILLIALSWTAHFTRVTTRKSWQITTQITKTPQIRNHDKSPQHHDTPHWPLPLHQGNKPQVTIQTTTQNTTTPLHLQLPQLF